MRLHTSLDWTLSRSNNLATTMLLQPLIACPPSCFVEAMTTQPGWKELIHSRLYTKRRWGGVTKGLCLSRGPFRCTLIRTRWKMMTGVFLGGPSLVCSTTKTIIPPLNTGSVTERPRKGFLHADERPGQL